VDPLLRAAFARPSPEAEGEILGGRGGHISRRHVCGRSRDGTRHHDAILDSVVGLAIVVLVGVPIVATIATALGVFACDPLEQDIRRRVRVTYFYIYMLLASLYAYAIYATSVWQRLASITLTALVAMALWQKARDRFDYLLDPSASPPPRISVSDGLIAALIFFVLQALVVALQLVIEGTLVATAGVIWIAFCGAGAVTYGLMRLVYWRSGASDVPRMFGKDVGKAMLWGIVAGALAALVGVVYLQVITSLDLFPEARQIIQSARAKPCDDGRCHDHCGSAHL